MNDRTLPAGKQVRVDAGFFVLPGLATGAPASVFGGGALATAVTDRPEVRAVMQRLMSPAWGSTWAADPASNFVPANAQFDPEKCRPPDPAGTGCVGRYPATPGELSSGWP